MPKRRGRPRLSKARLKSCRLMVKLTPSERARLGAMAARHGCTLADALLFAAGVRVAESPLGPAVLDTPPLP